MKKEMFLFVIFFLIFFIPILDAAPHPWGIAINPDTEQCTGFWPGDEFSECILPEGWNAYCPPTPVIETDYGECNFTQGKEEQCCKELNLEYVEDPGIECVETDLAKKRKYSFIFASAILILGGIIIVLLLIGLIIFFYKKKTK